MTFGAWLNQNLDVVRAHSDCWLAVDPDRGTVVISEQDQEKFDRAVEVWEALTERGPWTFHTSSILQPPAPF